MPESQASGYLGTTGFLQHRYGSSNGRLVAALFQFAGEIAPVLEGEFLPIDLQRDILSIIWIVSWNANNETSINALS